VTLLFRTFEHRLKMKGWYKGQLVEGTRMVFDQVHKYHNRFQPKGAREDISNRQLETSVCWKLVIAMVTGQKLGIVTSLQITAVL